MNEKLKNIITVSILAVFLFGLSIWCWIKQPSSYSDSERRVLATLPEFSRQTVFSGEFMSNFESYAADQFPIRDRFRSVKSFSELRLFGRLETNGLYEKDGYLSKIEYPYNKEMLTHASNHFRSIYDKYISGNETNIYFSIVPDKNYFLADKSGRISLDYNNLVEDIKNDTEYMKYIDIFNQLTLEDYYKTDTHWKQESIQDVANIILSAMGNEPSAVYETQTLDYNFYGVYYDQLALPSEPDTIKFLTNEMLESCTVISYNTGIPVAAEIYDIDKVFSKDPYEMFLGGATPLIVINNPSASSNKELIIFRDSFGSSLAPLLVESYSEITLIDTRYMNSSMIGNFIDFTNQDILFIYSTLILNNSLALK